MATTNGTATVLLAEEEASIRQLMLRMLEGCGYALFSRGISHEGGCNVETTGLPLRPANPHTAPGDQVAARHAMDIGKFLVVKGQLTGSEDLAIDGRFEGTIDLRDHALTIGSNARIEAPILARAVTICGTVSGNVTATETVDIRETGTVKGNIVAPRVAIVEGAHFDGRVDMPLASIDEVAA